MNVTHMLYEYSTTVDYIKSLIENGWTETAIIELEKLSKEITSDYITSLAV